MRMKWPSFHLQIALTMIHSNKSISYPLIKHLLCVRCLGTRGKITLMWLPLSCITLSSFSSFFLFFKIKVVIIFWLQQPLQVPQSTLWAVIVIVNQVWCCSASSKAILLSLHLQSETLRDPSNTSVFIPGPAQNSSLDPNNCLLKLIIKQISR